MGRRLAAIVCGHPSGIVGIMIVKSASPSPVDAPLIRGEMTRGRRFALLGALYSTQNLSLAAYNYAFLIAAQRAGVSLEMIGMAAGVATILVLKFLWAPLVDRFSPPGSGHYRSWLILCQSALVIGALVLALLDPGENFVAILAVFGLIFLFAGTQDVAADATATRILGSGDRGIGNGIQSAGASVAQVIGGGVILFIVGSHSWAAAMIALAVMSAIPLPFVLRWKEAETTGHLEAPKVAFADIRTFFTRPGVVRWAVVVLPLYVFGGTAAYNIMRPMLTDAGWSEERLGLVVVVGGGIAGILAGLAGGIAISSLGRRRGFLILGLVQILAAAATVALSLNRESMALSLAVTVLGNAGFAAASAVVFTISMDLTRQASAGTDFTLFSSITGVVMVLSGGAAVALSGSLGFTTVSAIALALSLIGVPLASALVGPVLDGVRSAHSRVAG